MLRFLHIIFLNAWRGLRRANAIPALTLVFVALCLLFVGSTALAGTSRQKSNNTILSSVLHPVTDVFGAGEGADSQVHKSASPTPDKLKYNAVQFTANEKVTNKIPPPVSGQGLSDSTATISLLPNPVVSVCEQGNTVYSIQSAQLTFDKPTVTDGNITWFWESRIDSGTNPSVPPIDPTQHRIFVPAGSTNVIISPVDVSQPLLNTQANNNYAYSFRLDVVAPFSTNSPWVGVPVSSTCSKN
jgi:hypothetical protein